MKWTRTGKNMPLPLIKHARQTRGIQQRLQRAASGRCSLVVLKTCFTDVGRPLARCTRRRTDGDGPILTDVGRPRGRNDVGRSPCSGRFCLSRLPRRRPWRLCGGSHRLLLRSCSGVLPRRSSSDPLLPRSCSGVLPRSSCLLPRSSSRGVRRSGRC